MKVFKNTETVWRSPRLIGAVTLLYLFSVGYAIVTQRTFFADGAHFFLKILEEKTFIYGDDFARHFAHYATQFIIVILIKMFHVTNLDILSVAFGFGLYFPQIVSLLICYLIVRKQNINYMVFPIIGLFGIVINSSFMMAHEAHVLFNIYWPILFYVILVKDYRWYDIVILLSLSVIFTRCYESAAILGSLLIVLTGATLIKQWHLSSIKSKAVRILLLGIFFVSVFIAVRSILYPRCPDNKAQFLSSFRSILKHWPVLLSSAYILVLSFCMIMPKFVKSPLFRFIVIILIVATLFISLIPVLMPHLTRPWLHYDARVYITYMLPLFSLVVYMVLKGIIRIPEFAWKQIVPLVIVLTVGQTTWQILATSQWAGFREVFREELNMHQGAVQIEDTKLVNENMGIQLLKPMICPWATPTLSILWSENQDVKAIILSSSSGWQPFDPLKPDILPKVEEYGFAFEKYITSVTEVAK